MNDVQAIALMVAIIWASESEDSTIDIPELVKFAKDILEQSSHELR